LDFSFFMVFGNGNNGIVEKWNHGLTTGSFLYPISSLFHYSNIPPFQFFCCIVTQKKEKFEPASSPQLGPHQFPEALCLF